MLGGGREKKKKEKNKKENEEKKMLRLSKSLNCISNSHFDIQKLFMTQPNISVINKLFDRKDYIKSKYYCSM